MTAGTDLTAPPMCPRAEDPVGGFHPSAQRHQPADRSARVTIGVAILTFQRDAVLVSALESVFAQTRLPDQVVVVESGPGPASMGRVRSRFPSVKWIHLPWNMGCPVGRSIAMANCSADVVYCLDDDGRLHESCLEIVERVFAAHPGAGVVASKVVRTNSPDQELVSAQLAKPPRRTVRFSGGASAIRRQTLLKSGYYPSDFWRQSEEADLAIRVIDSGFEILYAPGAVMFHPPGVSSNPATLYYGALNSLRSVVRLCPWRYIVFVLPHQVGRYVRLGMTHRAMSSVIAGLLRFTAELPALLRGRRPVRPATMRTFLEIRLECKTSMRGPRER